MEKEAKLKTTIYLPESVIWLLRETAVQQRISSDSAAMEAAIRCWHSSINDKLNPSSAPIRIAFSVEDLDNLDLTEPVRKLLRMLIGILLSEKDDAIRAVRENLEVFYKYTGGDPEHVEPIDFVTAAKSAAAAGPGAVGRDALPYRESGDDLRPSGTRNPAKSGRRSGG
ncbi:MAG: hypothetical protein JOZ32_17380 [Bryobacterales bacterium]|nr:hypothetical protein [Bryobacterales bacterium]